MSKKSRSPKAPRDKRFRGKAKRRLPSGSRKTSHSPSSQCPALPWPLCVAESNLSLLLQPLYMLVVCKSPSFSLCLCPMLFASLWTAFPTSLTSSVLRLGNTSLGKHFSPTDESIPLCPGLPALSCRSTLGGSSSSVSVSIPALWVLSVERSVFES